MPVLHEESLRPHYALTLRDWCANLTEHWEECVAEVGEPTARLWGLYMGACQYGFEDGRVELHHVLAVAPGGEELPLRPWWAA